MQDILLNEYAAELFPPSDSWEITAGFAGISVKELVGQALFRPTRLKVIDVKGKGGEPDTRSDVKLIPGHIWGGTLGPQPANVMIVGKMPGQQELIHERNLVGPVGDRLRDAFKLVHTEWDQFFVTNVLHFIPPDGGSKVRAYHVRDCATLLMHELLVVHPKYILLLGIDAIKFFFGRKATLRSTRGAIIPIKLGSDIGQSPNVRAARDDWDIVEIEYSTHVMTTVHPAQVLREPKLAPGFEEDIHAFSELIAGRRSAIFIAPDAKYDYQYVSDAETLNGIVDKLITDGVTELSVDCEWGGEDYITGWLRTIQFSWAPGKAVVVILRNCESQRTPIFQPTPFHALDALHRLFDRDGVHIYGQYFRSDALWLEDIGLRVMKRLTFDTMLADHALNESQEHGLTAMTVRYTNMGRYDIELTQWVKDNPCPDGGYGSVPDALLHPYAAADVDAVMRIVPILRAELAKPENAAVARLFYEIVLPSCQPIHEMEITGIRVDPERMIDLLWQYDTRKKELLQELRGMISWPDFNPRSFIQKAKLLFGSIEEGGLGLLPIKSTEKPSREWADVLKLPPEERARINPSTDAESLELLSIDASTERQQKVVEVVQQVQTIDQVTKNFLRPPAGVSADEIFLPGHFELDDYTEGLLGHAAEDGRIHTTISQIKETGRYGSSCPNLQNISKRQEPRYQAIMGYKIPKIRSCFVASPGYVLVEADYKSAEIVTLAYISGDSQLQADALGPVKLHAKVAVDILGANCDYSEVAEKFPHLYVGAKAINFGQKKYLQSSLTDVRFLRKDRRSHETGTRLSGVWRLLRSRKAVKPEEVLYSCLFGEVSQRADEAATVRDMWYGVHVQGAHEGKVLRRMQEKGACSVRCQKQN